MFTTLPLVRSVMVCSALAAGFVVAPAFASSEDDGQHVVRFTPSDLASDARVAALYGRLQAASRDVCSSSRGRDITSMKSYRACYAKALEDAVNTVNQQTLTALHNAPGAKAAKVEGFRCTVEQASNETGERVDGARCTVTLRAVPEGERSCRCEN